MKHLFYLWILLLSFNLFLQTNDNNSSIVQVKELSETEFSEAKSLCLKMTESETWKASKSNFTIIFSKLKKVPFPKQNDDMQKYFQEHLHETDFKLVDEAMALITKGLELEAQVLAENREFYSLVGKASKEQLHEIFKPVHDYLETKYSP